MSSLLRPASTVCSVVFALSLFASCSPLPEEPTTLKESGSSAGTETQILPEADPGAAGAAQATEPVAASPAEPANPTGATAPAELPTVAKAVEPEVSGEKSAGEGSTTTAALQEPPVEKPAEVSPEAPPEEPGEKPTEEPSEKPAPGPAEDPPKEQPKLTPDCQKLLDDIRSTAKEIPLVFRTLSRSIDEIDADMVKVDGLCRKFLKECGSASPAILGEVKTTLARMLVGRDAHFRQELKELGLTPEVQQSRLAERYAEVIKLGVAAGASCPKGSPSWLQSQRMLMEAYLKTRQYQRARDVGALMLAEDPDRPTRAGVIGSIAISYMAEKKYEEAVEFLGEMIKKHADDPEYVVYNIRLFEAMNGAGDLEGIEDLMHLIRAEYPSRIETAPRGALRGQYEQWYYCQATFWLGFVRMALGDAAEAAQHFETNAREISSLEAQSKAEKTRFDSVCKIFRDFRSEHLLQYLQDVYGKKPEVTFKDVKWATEKKLSLEESLGKVVVIVARKAGDQRAGSFLQEMSRAVQAREADGAVGVCLGFLSGKENPVRDAGKMQKMREDLATLGVTLPAGFDPDRKRQGLIRDLFLTVGTASCVMLNRKGEFAWFLADPRDMDRKIAVRVLDRLLTEE